MQLEIPIPINKKAQKGKDNSFKFASPQLLQVFKKMKTPSAQKIYHKKPEIGQQSIDPDYQCHSARTRRISSSAASKRFPKDFFRDQSRLLPIKSSRCHYKQHEQDFFDTFGRKILPANRQKSQKQQAVINQYDTPKFKKKYQKIQETKKLLSNHRSNQKLKRQRNKQKPSASSLMQIKAPVEQVNQELIEIPIVFTSIPLITNFNLTLGQKGEFFTVQKTERRNEKTKIDEKQNSHNAVVCRTSRQRNNCKRYSVFRIQKKAVG